MASSSLCLEVSITARSCMSSWLQASMEHAKPYIDLPFPALCNPTCEPLLMQRRCEPSIGLLQAAYIRSSTFAAVVLVVSTRGACWPSFSAWPDSPTSSLISRGTVDFRHSIDTAHLWRPPRILSSHHPTAWHASSMSTVSTE